MPVHATGGRAPRHLPHQPAQVIQAEAAQSTWTQRSIKQDIMEKTRLLCRVGGLQILPQTQSESPSIMSILIGIAVLFGVIFAMFSGAVSGGLSEERKPQLSLRARPDAREPGGKMELLLEGSDFAPDSTVRFIAWHLPDGHGHSRKDPVESTRPHKFRMSTFDDVPFEPAIALAAYAGEGDPHDIKVIATDDHGNAAEAWISGREFYLKKESSVAA